MLFFLRKNLTFLDRGDSVNCVCRPLAHRIGRLILVSFVPVFFLGCALKRNGYDVPEVSLPAQYRNALAEEILPAASAAGEGETKLAVKEAPQDPGMIEWWRSFGSAELAALIDRGIANNPDVRIATLKIAQVKARADQVRADRAPSISSSLGSSVQAPGGQVGSVPVGAEDNKTVQRLYQASIRGNWRIDLWGEQSALAESAGLQVWQAVFERDNVHRSMVANLAATYVEYLSLNDRLRIAQEAEAVLSGILATIEKRIQAGDATLIELDQQKAAIFAVRATIPNLEQQREDAIASIAFLVGTVPGALTLSGDGLDTLLLPQVVPALPSSLVLRRPDVRMVEAKLLAADADVDVARARILPPLDLSAQVGYSSLAMSRLFQPASLFWNAIANLTVSIFDSGKLSSQKEQAKIVHEEMVETYARTIYQAVREVESALAGIRLTAKRFDAQQEATAAAQRAWDSSNEVYAVGGLDHLTLLDAGRTYLRYLDDYQRIKMDRYRGYISLFQALGGGADFGQAISGKGVRPTPARGKLAAPVPAPAVQKAAASEGVEWAAGNTVGDSGGWRVEDFWQIELPGLYHRAAIGPTWRDLRARYPKLMEGRIVRPRLSGRIEDSADGQASWYRLYVAKFSTPAAAELLCAAMKASHQRCRVVSSTSDETVESIAAAGPGERPNADVLPSSPNSMAPPAEYVDSPAGPAAAAPADREKRAEPVLEKLAYTIQLGAFSNLENAAIAYAFWRFKEYEAYVSAFRDTEGRNWYAVRTGVFPLRRDASAAAVSLRRKTSAHAVVVPMLIDQRGKPSALALSELKLPASTQVSPVIPEPPEAPLAVVQETRAALPVPSDDERDGSAYSVQLGAFSAVENAAVSSSFWQAKGYDVFVSEIRDVEGRTWFAVRTGIHARRNEAAESALFLGRAEDAPAVVVKTAIDRSGRPKAIDLRSLAQEDSASVARGNSAPASLTQPSKGKSFLAQKTVFKGKKAYTVQLGAFASLRNAARSLAEWQARGYEAYVCEILDAENRVRYAVRAGAFSQRRDAAALVRSLGRQDDVPALLVPALLDRSGRLAVVDVSAFNPLHDGEN